MSKNRKPPRGALADPTKLKPFQKNSDQIRVVIETPKGSRNNFSGARYFR